MKGTHLGEFEELVLLVVGVLFDNAYGVAVKKEIEDQAQRRVTLSTVHAALHRLEKKGFVQSRLGDPTSRRGGKRKRLFVLTAAGSQAIQRAQQLRQKLWEAIPGPALKLN